MNHWPLLGMLVLVAGFVLRLHPMRVVIAAGLATGLLCGLSIVEVLALLGEAFRKARYLALFVLMLPVIGLLERNGLREYARQVVGRLRKVTPGRLLLVYLGLRQLTAGLGMTSLGGHAQSVRPLLAPMAEAAAERLRPQLEGEERARLRALAAATDNVALFFGEDLFLAFGAVLLMQGFLSQNGISAEPLRIACWGIPSALCAFGLHAGRLLLLDRRLRRGDP